jgi:serine protease Do
MYWITLAAGLIVTGAVHAQTREEKVRADRKKVEADGYWVYNDLPRGFAEAKRTGKPLLVVLRCIPCEECVKLDDELVNTDPMLRPLLDKFVRVRIVSTNSLDLSLFQYDYDQSFACFLLNADGTIYGRFGTRSHRTYWSDDVSIEGLAKALQGALDLHRQYPANKSALAGKRGQAPEVPSPEKYPLLKDRFTASLNYSGEVAKSCIHCHQIGDAQKVLERSRHKPLAERTLFPYPHPKAIGLVLDPKEAATVSRTEADTPAAQASFRPGDRITALAGQPLLSIADVQWVLHRADPAGASIPAEVRREGQSVKLTLTLPPGWRHADDISWRASSWGLRRMALGGMALEPLPAEERAKEKLPADGMALRVRLIGQGSGPQGAAARAGVKKGDVLVSFDGRSDLVRETDLLAYAVTKRMPGERVQLVVMRDGQRLDLTVPMQE